LDIAAEYIASQFRRAGLKPVGDDAYFQTAHYVTTEQSLDGAELTVRAAETSLRIPNSEMRILAAGKAEFSGVTPLKIRLDDVKPDSVTGRVVVVVTKRRDAMAILLKLK